MSERSAVGSPALRWKIQPELIREGDRGARTDACAPHVLLALDQFPRALGGGERVVLRLAGLLPQYGYRVSILTLGVDPQSAMLNASTPCPIYLLPLRRTYGPEAFTAARQLGRFLRDQQVRIVQTFFESSDLWVGPVAKLTSDAKVIWSRRDMGILRQRKHSMAYRLMARLPDRVFAVSDQVRRHCIEIDGIAEDRVETLYNGIDLAQWDLSSRGPRSEITKVVTIGNLRRVKGHDLFVRAAAVVANEFPTVHFGVAGEVLEPDFYVELQELIRKLGLVERFNLSGGITNLPAYLQDAAVFVLPSRSEGFSNAIIEAMAAGLPIVATDVGGNAEAVIDGTTGRIVPSEDVHALASAMREMLSYPERAAQMGEAGRRRVQERFTTEAMMRQLVTAYLGLLGR